MGTFLNKQPVLIFCFRVYKCEWLVRGGWVGVYWNGLGSTMRCREIPPHRYVVYTFYRSSVFYFIYSSQTAGPIFIYIYICHDDYLPVLSSAATMSLYSTTPMGICFLQRTSFRKISLKPTALWIDVVFARSYETVYTTFKWAHRMITVKRKSCHVLIITIAASEVCRWFSLLTNHVR